MLKLIIALAPVGIILFLSEVLWRKKIIKGEIARKFIHILAGVWIAFWPHYLPFDGIFVLGCVALTLIIYSRFTTLLHAIYAVKRKTYGDIFYALAIISTSLLAGEPWVFTVAILYLSVADGAAALFGSAWGKTNAYKVFNYNNLQKSAIGTLAFFLLAVACSYMGWLSGGSEVIRNNALLVFVILPLVATLIENFSPYGVDNIITPLVVVFLLNRL